MLSMLMLYSISRCGLEVLFFSCLSWAPQYSTSPACHHGLCMQKGFKCNPRGLQHLKLAANTWNIAAQLRSLCCCVAAGTALVRWTCFNTLFLLYCIHAHNACPWDRPAGESPMTQHDVMPMQCMEARNPRPLKSILVNCDKLHPPVVVRSYCLEN